MKLIGIPTEALVILPSHPKTGRALGGTNVSCDGACLGRKGSVCFAYACSRVGAPGEASEAHQSASGKWSSRSLDLQACFLVFPVGLLARWLLRCSGLIQVIAPSDALTYFYSWAGKAGRQVLHQARMN